MIAIHHRKGSFSEHWISYCKEGNIPFKLVNCYDSNIIEQLVDCDALMWHFHHMHSKDTLFAKQLLYAVQSAGKKVFPDFHTMWHFDDKVGQKYLLEATQSKLVPSYVFYSLEEVIKWCQLNTFPKVFKLRTGSGSSSVQMVKTKNEAIRLSKKAFSKGFRVYNASTILKDKLEKFKVGKTSIKDLTKSFARIIFRNSFEKIHGNELGYVYLQDYIPNNDYDIRITYVNKRCFGLRRKVRNGDFRASGSGMIEYDIEKIPMEALKIAFTTAENLQLQTAAFDFVLNNNEPLILEISYGFGFDEDQFNHGFWNKKLEYFPGTFNPYGWMVDLMLQ